MTEKEIENSILQYLSTVSGGYFWKVNSSGIYNPKYGGYKKKTKWDINGVSDICGVYHGVFCAFEVKRPKCHPSKVQNDFIKNIIDCGGIAGVVRSIEDVKELLEGM